MKWFQGPLDKSKVRIQSFFKRSGKEQGSEKAQMTRCRGVTSVHERTQCAVYFLYAAPFNPMPMLENSLCLTDGGIEAERG